MNLIHLAGCQSTPLLSYLQGFGVLRLLHEQLDKDILSHWVGTSLCLETNLSQKDIEDFFINQYQPSPIISPWNGGGGFRKREPQKGEKAVEAIRLLEDTRFQILQSAIDKARELVCQAQEMGWADKTGKINNKDKLLFMAACRAEFPDEALGWLDSAFVITDDKKPSYPILLGGTGGNLGRGDLAVNFLESISSLLDSKKKTSADLLNHALFGKGRPRLESLPVGQFGPAAVGTINSYAYGSAASAVNPWGFVLAMEGSLLFASGVARRFSGSKGIATSPFAVSNSAVDYTVAENESVKGELWLPIWNRKMTVPELRRILSEGRLSWGSKHVSNGVDAAKAISTLGVDRGLASFERYVMAVRFGQMTLAIPTGSFQVTERPTQRVQILSELDSWVGRLRRGALPSSAQASLRRVEKAQIKVVKSQEDPKALQDVLAEIAHLEWVVSHSSDLRVRVRYPIPLLNTKRWCPLIDDGSVEWRLALSIATQHDDRYLGRDLTEGEQRSREVACFLRPVRLRARPYGHNRLEWADRVSGSANPVSPSIINRLISVLTERAILSHGRQVPEEIQTIGSGAPIAFDFFSPVTGPQLMAFLSHQIDDQRLNRLVSIAALLADRPRREATTSDRGVCEQRLISPPRALLGPFFHPRAIRVDNNNENPDESLMIPSLSWPQQLRAGHIHTVIREALIRLHAAGFHPAVRAESMNITSTERQRLLASLMIPISTSTVRYAIKSVCPPVADPATEGET